MATVSFSMPWRWRLVTARVAIMLFQRALPATRITCMMPVALPRYALRPPALDAVPPGRVIAEPPSRPRHVERSQSVHLANGHLEAAQDGSGHPIENRGGVAPTVPKDNHLPRQRYVGAGMMRTGEQSRRGARGKVSATTTAVEAGCNQYRTQQATGPFRGVHS